MKSSIGRPRRVTDEQVRVILAWRAQIIALKQARKAVKTIRQLAQELNLSAPTISDVIKNGGKFKTPSPEVRPAALLQRRETQQRRRPRVFKIRARTRQRVTQGG